MSIRLEAGDCRQVVSQLGVTVDSIVCDPPYDLVAMTKRFGKSQAAAKSPDHQRFARGFMNRTWDGEGVAFDPETWRILGEALRPGGFLLAFGAPRTHHRLASAIEDAGFVIQDCLMWLFATGFPKRRDMLKPAYEPIVVAYKPGGARTLRVDECRIAAEKITCWGGRAAGGNTWDGSNCGLSKRGEARQVAGRWPANICHDGSDEVLGLFDRFGEHKVGSCTVIRESGKDRNGNTSSVYGAESRVAGTPTPNYGDSGSAARFFFSAKAQSQDRWGSKHPTVKPVELMKWLVALVTPPGALVLDPFAGSGTTGVAALATGRDCIMIEREPEYLADIRERLAFYEGEGRHSISAKARRVTKPRGETPLFNFSARGGEDGVASRSWQTGDAAPVPYDENLDAVGSYYDAMSAIKESGITPFTGYFSTEREE